MLFYNTRDVDGLLLKTLVPAHTKQEIRLFVSVPLYDDFVHLGLQDHLILIMCFFLLKISILHYALDINIYIVMQI